MNQDDHISERAVVRCLDRECNFLDVDVNGPGVYLARRHADDAEHHVEVRVDALFA